MTSILVLLILIVIGGTGRPAQAQSHFEKDPVFHAKDLVAPELLKGPHYGVDGRVPVKDFLYRFTLRTDYGTFEVHGAHMLQIRVLMAPVWKRNVELAEQANVPGKFTTFCAYESALVPTRNVAAAAPIAYDARPAMRSSWEVTSCESV